ncbi:MAG: L-dopachrome tautomerase-related protein [Planctomycetota bacterium]
MRLVSAIAVCVLLCWAPAVLGQTPKPFEVLAELDQRPGNPTVGPDGTVYFSMHPMDGPEFKVMRLGENGTAEPYPTAKFSRSLSAVIGIAATRDGVLWVLDMGGPESTAKLVGWDTTTETLHAVHYLPKKEVSVANSFFQDFAIDEVRGKAFIADMSRGDMVGESRPGIVVVDLDTGHARRVLEAHPALQPKEDRPATAEGNPMTFTGPDGQTQPLRLGLNPIGIDQANRYVYFSTITPGPMYRIDAALLGDPAATEEQLAAAIEDVGPKPTSDGIAVDGETVYITNLEDNAITALRDGKLHDVARHAELSWPDGVAVAADGSLVVTVNQLHRVPAFNGGEDGGEPPFMVVRIPVVK